MSRALRLLGILVVACLVAGAGVSLAQDKPAAGQDKKETASAADPLTGDWDGTVESPNGNVSFTLKLKLDKDKVTGEIASDQGGTTLTGTWTEGKLAGNFDFNGTAVVMTGTIKDGVFSGEMNFGGGQMIMAWSAKKKA
jgi:hypothetical protein